MSILVFFDETGISIIWQQKFCKIVREKKRSPPASVLMLETYTQYTVTTANSTHWIMAYPFYIFLQILFNAIGKFYDILWLYIIIIIIFMGYRWKHLLAEYSTFQVSLCFTSTLPPMNVNDLEWVGFGFFCDTHASPTLRNK